MLSIFQVQTYANQLLYTELDDTYHSLYFRHTTINRGSSSQKQVLSMAALELRSTRLSFDVIRQAIERSQKRETCLQMAARYWKKESSEFEKSVLVSLATTGVLKAFQYGSSNLAFPLLPLSTVALLVPTFPFGAYVITAAVPLLAEKRNTIAKYGSGFLVECANIMTAGVPLFSSLALAGITDQAIDSQLKNFSPGMREATKCAAGIGLGAIGEIVSAILLGAACPSVSTAACIGGGAYLSVRAIKWLVSGIL